METRKKKYFQQGIVELYIAIAYYRKSQPDCLQSKTYFQSCLKNFELAERQDLVCENITLLCRILRNLKEWDTLYDTAIESKKLHQNYETQLQLVEDYSFLAEATLEKLELNTVEEYAEEALLILEKISEVRPPLRCSHPRFILAKLQEKQNQTDAAIDSLEKARKEINRQYDIYGYSEILNNSTVKLWNLQNDRLSTFCSSSDCEKEPLSHKDRVMSVSFSNSGELVASASLDNTVKLWKLDSKFEARLITTLEGHSNGVYGVSFSPDCKTIVSAGADITIRLWQLDRMDNILLMIVKLVPYTKDSLVMV